MKPGDRVKTDRRDAETLARGYRAGDLTPVWVPDAAHEALRDLVRAREAAKKDQLRARHRLGKFLLRQGRQRPATLKQPWTAGHLDWIRILQFEHAAQQVVLVEYLHEVEHVAARLERLEVAIVDAIAHVPAAMGTLIQALQALRGVAALTAVTIVAVGDLTRFPRARQLMASGGLVPSERTSGSHRRQGGITKTGNAHLRRVLGEAAWAYRYAPAVRAPLRARHAGLDPASWPSRGRPSTGCITATDK